MGCVNSVGKKSKRVAAMLENGIKEGVCAADGTGARIETRRGRFGVAGKTWTRGTWDTWWA